MMEAELHLRKSQGGWKANHSIPGTAVEITMQWESHGIRQGDHLERSISSVLKFLQISKTSQALICRDMFMDCEI